MLGWRGRKILQLCLLMAVFSLCGCGDFVDRLGTDSEQRVPHQSWGSYNLYQYRNGGWALLVDLGVPTRSVPDLGERPVVLVHGLGDRIIGPFDGLAQNLLSNGATNVFAFEYDSLDPIQTNGGYFAEALDFLTTREVNRRFRIVAPAPTALGRGGARPESHGRQTSLHCPFASSFPLRVRGSYLSLGP